MKLSISIPYKKRLDNIAVIFEALANQTMASTDFEVIVGAMEYCEDYIALCRRYTDRVNIVSVLSADAFSIPKARNLAMRQATGEVIVQMDADTLLPPVALQKLYDHYFAFGQKVCVVGQVVGYENNHEGHIEHVEAQPYQNYQQAFIDLERSKGKPRDPRFQTDHIIPWALAWTGLIALPLSAVRSHHLYFDESFQGWGIDDLEWSYRICKNGIPIVLREDIQAIHLPHPRDPEANRKTEKENYRRFLSRWPGLDVELAHTFGDIEANALYLDYVRALEQVKNNQNSILGTVRGIVNGKDVLIVGVELDEQHRIMDANRNLPFDHRSDVEILPLVGMALPYLDQEIHECRVMPSVIQLPDLYWQAVRREVERVSRQCILP